MVKAVIYCRCSTEEESQQDALKKQVIEARTAVEEKGWLLVQEYIEAKSGTSSDKRDKYRALYEDLTTEKFEIVVIKSQDRLMRNVKDWYLFLDRLVTNGKKLFMYLENKFYSTDDSLITGIKAILAEEYSKELGKKINNAHRNRQKNGKVYILPPNTYGLQRVGKSEYRLVESEVEAIQLMFHLAKMNGCGVIARILEENGYRKRDGEPFDEEAVRRIIRNPIRCGTVIQNKLHYDFQLKKTIKNPKKEWIVHKNAVPASISEEMWLEANAAMDERAKKRNVADYRPRGKHSGKYDLSEKMRCGLCGNPYYRRYRKKYKSGDYVIEWKCSKYFSNGRKGCDNIFLPEERMFQILKQLCEQYYQGVQLDSKSIIEKTILVLKKALKTDNTQKKYQKLEKSLEALHQLQGKLLDKLLDDIISDDMYKQKKEELDQKENSLQQELAVLQSAMNMRTRFEERIEVIRKRLEEETVEKATISEMLDNIEVIVVYTDHLEIRFLLDRLLGIEREIFQSLYEDTEELDDFFVIHFPLPRDFVYEKRKRIERERIVEYMKENPCITAKQIAEIEGISLTAANYRIKKLKQQKKICFDGKGGHGQWTVYESEEEK